MLEPTTVYTPSPARYDSMTYNHVGTSGLKLPAVSLGFGHNFGDITPYATMRDIVFTAFDNGITHFDLANNYGPEPGSAEKNCGRLLHEYFHHHRDELIISTKAGYEMWTGPYGDLGSRKYLLASLDQSLERLGLDYVDIFYHHRPDPETPLEETMGALAQAVASGKALYVACRTTTGHSWSGRRRSSMNCTCRSSSTRTVTTSSTAPWNAMGSRRPRTVLARDSSLSPRSPGTVDQPVSERRSGGQQNRT